MRGPLDVGLKVLSRPEDGRVVERDRDSLEMH